jgi:hypothetical protein
VYIKALQLPPFANPAVQRRLEKVYDEAPQAV